jgi:hypothetical protein
MGFRHCTLQLNSDSLSNSVVKRIKVLYNTIGNALKHFFLEFYNRTVY